MNWSNALGVTSNNRTCLVRGCLSLRSARGPCFGCPKAAPLSRCALLASWKVFSSPIFLVGSCSPFKRKVNVAPSEPGRGRVAVRRRPCCPSAHSSLGHRDRLGRPGCFSGLTPSLRTVWIVLSSVSLTSSMWNDTK